MLVPSRLSCKRILRHVVQLSPLEAWFPSGHTLGDGAAGSRPRLEAARKDHEPLGTQVSEPKGAPGGYPGLFFFSEAVVPALEKTSHHLHHPIAMLDVEGA